MVEISVQILASSISIEKENLRYKVKTWWGQVDVNDSREIIKLPALPMIEHYYHINGKQTIIFVEMWYRNLDLFPPGTMRFLGMAKCQVDDLLKNPSSNPSVEWLEVYDPIEDIVRGRLLLKIDAKFITSTSLRESTEIKSPADNRPSSYFTPEHLLNIDSKNVDASPSTTTSSSVGSKSPQVHKLRNVPVQADSTLLSIGCPTGLSNSNQSGYEETEIQSSPKATRFSTTRSEKGNKETINRNKRLGQKLDKGSPFNVKVAGKTYTIELDNNLESKVTCRKSKTDDVGRKSCSVLSAVSSREDENETNDNSDLISSENTSEKKNFLNFEEEDVIHLLNDNFDQVLESNFSKSGNDTKSTNFQPEGQTLKSSIAHPNILQLRRQYFDRTKLTQQNPVLLIGSPSGSSSSEIYNKGTNFSPESINTARESDDLTILGLGMMIKTKSTSSNTCNVNQTEFCLSQPSSSFINTISNSSITKSEMTTMENKERPQRSRRIVAAIYNDFE